eukprot:7917619-Karenia_brevis.AAC.1
MSSQCDPIVLPSSGQVLYEDPFKALGNMFDGDNCQECDVRHKIGKGWAKFGELKPRLCCKKAGIRERIASFHVHVSSAMLWSVETCTPTRAHLMKFQVAMISIVFQMVSRKREAAESVGQFIVRVRSE